MHDKDLLKQMLAERAPGVLEMQKAHMLKAMWKQLDVDGSGELDVEEVTAVLVLMGQKREDIDIRRVEAPSCHRLSLSCHRRSAPFSVALLAPQVMQRIDKDNSGTVEFDEFELWYTIVLEQERQCFRVHSPPFLEVLLFVRRNSNQNTCHQPTAAPQRKAGFLAPMQRLSCAGTTTRTRTSRRCWRPGSRPSRWRCWHRSPSWCTGR